MIRKFNYTGRVKIKRDRVDISLIDEAPAKSFTASLNLEGLGFSNDAKVYIEPYHQSSFMRFPFGTVGKIISPENTVLSDIPSTSIILFNIKVVDETSAIGRLIARADRIRPKELEESGNKNKVTILIIDWDKDLDQQIFRVTFPDDNDFPRLEINKSIKNRRELVKSDQMFRSLIFPVVMKEVVSKIASTGIAEDFQDGDDSWQSKWLKFIRETLYVDTDISFVNGSEDEITNWIESVVSAFCKKNKFRSKYEQTLK